MEYYGFTFAGIILLLAIWYVSTWYRLKKGLRILMYHHIGNTYDEKSGGFFVLTDVFEKQLDLINKEGFHPISLSEVEDAFIHRKAIPERSVLLTFDDGYANNYACACPVITRKNIPVTIFLNVGEIGRKEEMLTWEQVREMQQQSLVEFASHGMYHKRLRKLSDEEAFSELSESKTILEKETGKTIKSFCYPFGAFDKRVRKLVFKAGYIMDFGTRKGINRWPWNPARPFVRAHVMHGESLEDFRKQLKTGYKKGVITWLF